MPVFFLGFHLSEELTEGKVWGIEIQTFDGVDQRGTFWTLGSYQAGAHQLVGFFGARQDAGVFVSLSLAKKNHNNMH